MSISQLCRFGGIFPRECLDRIFLPNNFVLKGHRISSRNIFTGNPKFQIPSKDNVNKLKSTKNYVLALAVLTLGCSYAAVPLYRIFCQASGLGGVVKHDLGGEKVEKMEKVKHRQISVRFTSDVSANMMWNFKPQQSEVVVIPGETALAFYSAKNPTDRPIIGISTYNILPFEAAPYFNKIQCFCFEEQMLNPKEQVDMPVFFYIDPEFCNDPKMENVDEVVLSYTFFEAKEGMTLPLPGFMK